MLTRIHMLAGRHRRAVLVVAVAVAVAAALGTGRQLTFEILGTYTSPFLVTLALLALILLLGGLIRELPRPAVLAVDPTVPAFRVPPSGTEMYGAVAVILFAATFVPALLPSAEPYPDRKFEVVTGALWLVIAAQVVVRTWHGRRLQLSAAGVHDSDVAGSLTVPWEALSPGQPARPSLASVALTYVAPHLVRRRGLRRNRRRLRIDSAYRVLIADAIRHYVDHPQHRAAIGTRAEHDRLLAYLASSSGVPHPDGTPR